VSQPAGEAPITVLIADDQALVRAGFRVMLEGEAGLEVIGEAADGQQAIDRARQLNPTVVLMDIRMPVLDGLHAAREIVRDTTSKVLVLTTFDIDEYVYEALRIGASGFLLKDAHPDELLSAVRVVARGDALIDPTVTRRLIRAFAESARPPASPPAALRALTPRELDVLRQIARGLSNSEIAVELFVEESTVRTHVTRILTKLGLRNRVQAVVLAYQTGLVPPAAEGATPR
jgi:DNA-binding NarL/FixJ family response regulator